LVHPGPPCERIDITHDQLDWPVQEWTPRMKACLTSGFAKNAHDLHRFAPGKAVRRRL
jgi:hypothetical protein